MTADDVLDADSAGRCDEASLLGRLVLNAVCQQALRQPRSEGAADYGPSLDYSRALADEPARVAADRVEQQCEEAPRLLLELLDQPYAERTAAIAKDARFHSAPLAALIIQQATRNLEQAEKLACTACLILEEVGEEGRGLLASAKVVLAEALRLKLELEEADAALVSAEEDLRNADLPWEKAELCFAFAQLRWDQQRREEAFALIERAATFYADLGAEQEAAMAWLETARWHVALGESRMAAWFFTLAIHMKTSTELRLSATRGLVQQLVLRGEPDLALEAVHSVQRNTGGLTRAQAAVLQSLEGQIFLRLAEPRKAQRLLEEALAVLLGSELHGDALLAGLALLVAGAPPRKVAAQLVPLVPPLWRKELLGLLEEVAGTGRVRPEQLAMLQGYLDLPESAA